MARRTQNSRTVFYRCVGRLGVAALAAACVAPLAYPSPAADIRVIDKLIIVDCLLPGQQRKLGGHMNYLGPRRAARLSASECEIRGGEYVSYDRADYSTSLHVWQPMAEQGDPTAQVYVGEIYEKGLGLPPDYAAAAMWYQKAADQGSARGENHLAYLYEQGLGVGKDPVRALNLYRTAAGLKSDELTFKSEVVAIQSAAQVQIDDLTAQLNARDTALQKGAMDLDETRAKLARAQSVASQGEHDTRSLRAQLHQLQTAPATATNGAEVTRLTAELVDRETRLTAQKAQIAELTQTSATQDEALRQRLLDAQQQEAKLTQQLGTAQAAAVRGASDLKAAQARAQSLQHETDDLKAHAADAERDLKVAQGRLAQLQGGKGGTPHPEADALKTTIAQQQVLLGRQTSVIANLTVQRQSLDAEIARLNGVVAEAQKAATKSDDTTTALRAQLASTQSELIRKAVEQRTLAAKLDADAQRIAEDDKALSAAVARAGSSNAEVQRLSAELAKRETNLTEQRGQLAALNVLVDSDRVAMQRYRQDLDTRGIAPVGAVSVSPQDALSPEFGLGQNFALIIGNADYPQSTNLPQLKTAAKDAREIDHVLTERYGFKGHTRVLINATRAQMIDALYEVTKAIGAHDNLVIYYAGHGATDQTNKRSYWLPVDADSKNPTNWISDREVGGWISETLARHVLIVADSCYSGAMTRGSSTQLVSNGTSSAERKRLLLLAKLPSRTVLTSGGSEPVLDSGPEGHSIFAREFIDILSHNMQVIETTSLYASLLDRVHSSAVRIGALTGVQINQTPQISWLADAGHETGGEFLFVPIGPPIG